MSRILTVYSARLQVPWSFDIELSSSSSGGVELNIINEKMHQDAITSSDGGGTPETPTGCSDSIIAAVKAIALDPIVAEIRNGLSGAHCFVLPGSGTFNTANPRFNRNGDFLCHLEYVPDQTDGEKAPTSA